ncbi:serine/threonine protein kinase [Phytophthora cinnamomi]|uniref:serine/threonine protein kinase n=1 Tax=Phytophthora cinnamomi TaxID=4785 RepID=UPI00355AB034|nr:serine/threonine protein kinase [Phytophthora cinnamomi]
MPVIHERYRVIRELSPTLYGWVSVCEDMHARVDLASPAAPISSVVIKQVSLERMTNIALNNSSSGHLPDNPVVEKEVANLVRAAGGHPNLVQYEESFVEQQTLYLVMEHCADGDLHRYLSSRMRHRMTCLSALSVLSQVASGMAFLHELGIAHRDISLENIMVHRGRCKLGDFGLATRSRLAGGRLVGKNYYMAPEIVAGDVYDPKSADIWSLGIVLFVLLTGSPLVTLASMSVKAFRVLKQAGIVPILQSWVWIDNPDVSTPKILGLSTSKKSETDYMKPTITTETFKSEANYDKAKAPIQNVNGTSVKLVSTSILGPMFLRSTSENGEFQDLIMWSQLPEVARTAFAGTEIGTVPFNDARFLKKLGEAWPF